MATEVEIANAALSRMGFGQVLQGDVDGTLANCTDSSFEFAVIERWYTTLRKRLLEDHPWTFARKNALLVLADDLTGPTDYWGTEWRFAYTYPADCVRARRFVGDTVTAGYGCCAGEFMPWPWPGRGWPFSIAVHAAAKVILTDVEEASAVLVYTENITASARFTEAFTDALTWWVAMEASIPLKVSMDHAQNCREMARQTKWSAKAFDMNEENPQPDPNGQHLSARRGR